MSIRYKCETCGSSLTIKDELAGTKGKCPKCKTPFVVPQPDTNGTPKEDHPEPSRKAAPATKEAKPKPAKATAPTAAVSTPPPSADDPDFDPVAFLMDDAGPRKKAGAAGRARSTPPPESDAELPEDLLKQASGRGRRRSADDEEDDDPKPAAAGRYRGSASATADAMLGNNSAAGASAGAKELLTRSVEESRARAARMDDYEEPKGPSQFSLVLQELVRLSPYIAAGLVGIIGLFWGVNSMVSTSFPLPELGYVTGHVTLDGKPLADARLLFSPTEREFELPSGRVERKRAASAITDENGNFELIYIDDIEGTAVGDNQVMISKMVDGREVVPGEYGMMSTVVKEVAPGSQEINFELKSPPRTADPGPQGAGPGPGTRNRAATGK